MSWMKTWVERRLVAALSHAGPKTPAHHAAAARHPVDLTDDIEPVLRLIEDRQWRHRLVETVVLRDGDHARVHSSFQIEFAPDFLEQFDLRAIDDAHLLIPLTTRPKQALIDFDVHVNGERGRGCLLPRSQIARVQAEYLHRLVLTSQGGELVRRGLPFPLLEAICVFTPGPWVELRDGRPLAEGIASYLHDAGLGHAVEPTMVSRWLDLLAPVANILHVHCGEDRSENDSAGLPLLALPELRPPERPRTVDDVTRLVTDYAAAVEAAARIADVELLTRLGVWGTRWPVIIETTVAAHQPNLVKLSEDRRLDFRGQGRLAHRLELADARSVHLEVRVEDHEVVLTKDFGLEDPNGAAVDIPTIQTARATAEALTFYSSSEEPRPDWVTAIISVAAAGRLRVTTVSAAVLTASAAVVATFVGGTDPADELAVVALPISVVSGLVVTREATPLAARLLGRHRLALGLVSVVFWMVILVRIIGFHPFAGA
jgi:hypothetical protein